jgi:cytochrome c oxidase subunit IV
MAEGTQQHPLKIYFSVWILLFVLSAFSYMVDWFQFEGYLRWFLILLFMLLKAGFICAIFMHMFWERLPIIFAILCPCFAVLVFVFIMWNESYYTFLIRKLFFMITGS